MASNESFGDNDNNHAGISSNIGVHETNTETIYNTHDEDSSYTRDIWVPPPMEAASSIGPDIDGGAHTETLYPRHGNDHDLTSDTWIPDTSNIGSDIDFAEHMEKTLTDMIKKKGLIETMKYVKDEMDRWKNQQVKFALMGGSAVGKSTYINTVRRVKYDMPNWAEEGLHDTTNGIKVYEHPENKRILFYDIPGYGYKVTKEEFLKSIEPVDQFDYFLLFFDKGLTADDKNMIKIVKDHYKPFCLVRTKLDEEITRGKRRNMDQKEIKSTVRRKIEESIEGDDTLKDSDIFLISCIDTSIGEFPELWNRMKQHLSKEKYEAMMLTLPIMTKQDIEDKFDQLQARIKYVAAAAGVISAIPVPFWDIPVNMYLLKREINIYVKAFSLDRDEVKNIPGRKFNPSTFSVGDYLKSGLRAFWNVMAIAGASQLDTFVPIIGSIMSYQLTTSLIEKLLLQQLTELKGEAIHIFNFLYKSDML